MSGESVDVKTSPAPTVLANTEKIIYVDFDEGDKRNPQNYSPLKKWIITLIVCCFTGTATAATASFSISIPSMTEDLHCTELQAALGLGLFAIGFAIVPLFTSSFSEEVGRKPVYIFSAVTFTLTQVMVSLAPDMKIVLAGRALGGIFGSAGFSLIGGSIADIWKPNERGLPMSLFSFSSFFGFGFGSVIGGVIQSTLGWRWVQWILIMVSCALIVLVSLMSETRSSVILIRIAQTQRKLNGSNFVTKAEIDKVGLWSLIKISCTRPLYFLLTEPIVQCISIWCGFAWGVVFCLLEAITPMFGMVYGFDVQQTGYVFVTLSVAAVIGFFANLYQNKLYIRHYARKKQEARLYLVCVAALCLPIGMFIFAWTASPNIHWIVPVIGLTVFFIGVTIIFQVAFLYLADCYNTYASSAQAGQSLFRNSMALVFSLSTQQMFDTLTYKWALMLFAGLALVLAPTPFVLFFYGSKIRARSVASQKIIATDAEASLLPTEFSLPLAAEGFDKV